MKNTLRFVLCVENTGHPAALDVRKVYQVIEDANADAQGLIRVIDESGEDYLYPDTFFVPIDVPVAAARMFIKQPA
jgi:hypothetical protein